jgi:type IV secretion system protein VirB2
LNNIDHIDHIDHIKIIILKGVFMKVTNIIKITNVIKTVLIGSLLTISNHAFANVGGALPWEAPLATIQASLTGPVAMSISILSMFVAGTALVWGEDISGFVRKSLMLVMAISFLVAGSSILTSLFGVTGALI